MGKGGVSTVLASRRCGWLPSSSLLGLVCAFPLSPLGSARGTGRAPPHISGGMASAESARPAAPPTAPRTDGQIHSLSRLKTWLFVRNGGDCKPRKRQPRCAVVRQCEHEDRAQLRPGRPMHINVGLPLATPAHFPYAGCASAWSGLRLDGGRRTVDGGRRPRVPRRLQRTARSRAPRARSGDMRCSVCPFPSMPPARRCASNPSPSWWLILPLLLFLCPASPLPAPPPE